MNRNECAAWIERMARLIGPGFHPDTACDDYYPPLPAEVAAGFDAKVQECYRVLGTGVYDIAEEAVRSMMGVAA